MCKECGGASICEHDRIRSVCEECGEDPSASTAKASKDVGAAVIPDSVFIVGAADSAVEDTSIFVAISSKVCLSV